MKLDSPVVRDAAVPVGAIEIGAVISRGVVLYSREMRKRRS